MSNPRNIEDIQKEYSQLCASLGQLEYQMFVYEKQAEVIREKLGAVNTEADARQKLELEKRSELAKQASQQTESVEQKGAENV